MENLTRERAHDLCVEMWNDIAENGYNEKEQSCICVKHSPKDDCFACEYYIKVNKELGRVGRFLCLGCPFDAFGEYGCWDDGSPYASWYDRYQKQEYAIAIADLFI